MEHAGCIPLPRPSLVLIRLHIIPSTRGEKFETEIKRWLVSTCSQSSVNDKITRLILGSTYLSTMFAVF